MLRNAILAAIGALLITNVSAMPLVKLGNESRSEITQRAKIVCEQDGFCYRPQIRKPVARWVYGDNVFYGPYVGPQYYGRPGYHSGWSFFGLW